MMREACRHRCTDGQWAMADAYANEVRVLARLRHPNIARFLGIQVSSFMASLCTRRGSGGQEFGGHDMYSATGQLDNVHVIGQQSR